jgi:hypothetical protein
MGDNAPREATAESMWDDAAVGPVMGSTAAKNKITNKAPREATAESMWDDAAVGPAMGSQPLASNAPGSNVVFEPPFEVKGIEAPLAPPEH